MILQDFLERLEAIRLHQQKIVMGDKPSPKVYEGLTALPVSDVIQMMYKVDEQLERDQIQSVVKQLRDALKEHTEVARFKKQFINK